jgi:hypothetical protein
MSDEKDTTPPATAADIEFEESLSTLRYLWGIDHTAAPSVLSEMDARGMDITPDGVRYSDASAVAVALGVDPGHGDHDDPPPPAPVDTTPRHAWVDFRASRCGDAMSSGTYDLEYPRDIISDAMHYAASIGLDPFAEIDAAIGHYRAESTDTGDGMNEDGDTLEVPA